MGVLDGSDVDAVEHGHAVGGSKELLQALALVGVEARVEGPMSRDQGMPGMGPTAGESDQFLFAGQILLASDPP